MNKTIIPIKGMHCRSCEILIEEKLKENPDIKNISISYKDKEARVYSHHPLNMGQMKATVIEAGYEVGIDDSKSWFSQNAEDYLDLLVSALLLIALYLIGKSLGIFNISTGRSGNPTSLLFVLVIGLTAGISTCMALVGGLVLGISARHAEKHPEATSAQKFRPHLFFNLGRIITFFLLGGFIGLIGKAFQLSGTLLGVLTIGVGVVMFILGLQLTEIFPRVSSGGLTLPSGISKILGIKKHHEKEYSHANSMLVGGLTFFLPCGFTQAMQLYAMSTGNFWSGALIMGAFALGTAPGLLGIGGLSSILKGAFAKKFFKFAGLLVLVLAIINISNGLNLTGWKSVFAQKSDSAAVSVSANDPNVTLENGVQVVRMTQLAGAYKPNRFTIRQGIPVKWIIDSKADTCAASITIPKLNIKKYLQPGDNVIEFTPKYVGDLRFSCLMGMYSGKFIVVTNDLPASTNSNQEVKPTPAPQSSLPVASTPTKPADIQKISATYIDAQKDIDPKEFTVSANKPVKFSVEVKERAWGCMSSITIPGLASDIYDLKPENNIVFEFTPTKKGTYKITCGMGVPRGKIIVT